MSVLHTPSGEQDNIRPLWDELVPVLEDVGRTWEIIKVYNRIVPR